MAIKKFNAVAGFSVGDDVVFEVIDDTASVSANNLTVLGVSQLGDSANVKIDGGTSGYILSTDGAGNLSWTDPTATGVSGLDTQVQFNENGLFGASANFTFDPATSILTVVGNVTASNSNLGNLATANFFRGSGNQLSNIQGSNVSGTVANATYAVSSGTVRTNAQPNITSLGTLSGLSSTGTVNFINSSNVSLGDVGNLHITGGNSGEVLKTDGAGGLTWASDTTAAAGSNTQVQFNDGGSSLGASDAFTFDTSSNVLTISGNITSQDANLGNLVTASFFTGTLTTGAQPNITSVGTLTSVSLVANGNITLSGTGSRISGANLVSGTFLTGTLTTRAQPNITSVGTLGVLTVSGNITAGNADLGNLIRSNYYSGVLVTSEQPNITSLGTLAGLTSEGTIDFTNTANVALGTVSNVHITGGVSGQVLSTDGSGGLSWTTIGLSSLVNGTSNVSIPAVNGNINMSVGGNANVLVVTRTGANVTGTMTATGNISGSFVLGNGFFLTGIAQATTAAAVANGTSNINIPTVDGNVAIAVGGTTNAVVITNAGINVAGYINATGNANVGNIGATNANITAMTASGNISSGNANLGNVATANFFTGTLTTSAQPNITSLGTLSNLTSNGTINFSNSSNVTLGAVGNIRISGGSSGQFLTTDGSGNVTWASVTGAVGIANGTSNISIPVSNGNINISVGGTSNVAVITTTGVNVAGYINSTGNITSVNANLGNLVTANFFSGSGNLLSNIQGSNISGTVANANYAAYAGNVVTAAQPNITSLGTLSGLTVNGVTNLGIVGNVKLSGGSLGYALITDGAGNLSFSPPSLYGGFVNVTKDSFTGNGTQRTFALTTVPSGVDAISVNINGITQFETSYSLSTNNLTFNTAPLNGSIIEVTIYGVAPIITDTFIPFSDGNDYVGTSVFTYISGTNTLNVPSITSTGNINFTSTSNVALGAVGNIRITGGTSGQFLTTNGSGGLSWATVSIGSSLSNGTSNVSIPTANGNVIVGVGGTANVVVVSTTGTNVTGNLTASNVVESTAGTLKLSTGTVAVSSGDAGIFVSGIGNINIGLAANITMGSNTGTQTIRGNVNAQGNVSITNLRVNDFYSNRSPINVTTNTVVDSFSVFTYRSAKYTMRVNSDDGFQAVEVLLIHDNSNSYVTIYGSLSTIGTDIITLATDINSGNVRLLVSTNSANTSVNLLGTYVTG